MLMSIPVYSSFEHSEGSRRAIKHLGLQRELGHSEDTWTIRGHSEAFAYYYLFYYNVELVIAQKPPAILTNILLVSHILLLFQFLQISKNIHTLLHIHTYIHTYIYTYIHTESSVLCGICKSWIHAKCSNLNFLNFQHTSDFVLNVTETYYRRVLQIKVLNQFLTMKIVN